MTLANEVIIMDYVSRTMEKTIKKFIARFSYMEKKTLEKHKFLKDLTLEQMDELWNEAKNFQ